MRFLEKDLETIIFEADRDVLWDRGLEIEGKLLRQVRIGNYGIADLISIERNTYLDNSGDKYVIINVIELKKNIINTDALLQAVRYMKGIHHYMRKNKRYIDVFYKITQIGDRLDENSSTIFLTDFIGGFAVNKAMCGNLIGIDIYTYNYDIDGITFDKKQNYGLVDSGF